MTGDPVRTGHSVRRRGNSAAAAGTAACVALAAFGVFAEASMSRAQSGSIREALLAEDTDILTSESSVTVLGTRQHRSAEIALPDGGVLAAGILIVEKGRLTMPEGGSVTAPDRGSLSFTSGRTGGFGVESVAALAGTGGRGFMDMVRRAVAGGRCGQGLLSLAGVVMEADSGTLAAEGRLERLRADSLSLRRMEDCGLVLSLGGIRAWTPAGILDVNFVELRISPGGGMSVMSDRVAVSAEDAAGGWRRIAGVSALEFSVSRFPFLTATDGGTETGWRRVWDILADSRISASVSGGTLSLRGIASGSLPDAGRFEAALESIGSETPPFSVLLFWDAEERARFLLDVPGMVGAGLNAALSLDGDGGVLVGGSRMALSDTGLSDFLETGWGTDMAGLPGLLLSDRLAARLAPFWDPLVPWMRLARERRVEATGAPDAASDLFFLLGIYAMQPQSLVREMGLRETGLDGDGGR